MTVRKRGRRDSGVTLTKNCACRNKNRYATAERANDARWNRIRSQGALPSAVNVYPCPFVAPGERPHWHVGHTPGNQMKR